MRTNKYDDLRLILSELIRENDTATRLGDIEIAIEKSVQSIVKLFDLPSVSNRRELLLAYEKWFTEKIFSEIMDSTIEQVVDKFLSQQ